MDFKRIKEEFINFYKVNPVPIFFIVGASAASIFWLFGYKTSNYNQDININKIEKPPIEGIESAVDPRDLWADKISNQINDISSKFQNIIDSKHNIISSEIDNLKNEIAEIKKNQKQIESSKNNIDANQNKILDNHEINIKNKTNKINDAEISKPNIAHLFLNMDNEPEKSTDNYVTSGSFARAVLLTGVVAETSIEAQSSPQPILLRIVDHGIFSKGYKTKQIKEAIAIGSCYGNIASERAICRLESISLLNKDQEIIERNIEGWIIGEDGRHGIKGEVVDKSSKVTKMAILNGILGGIAGYFQNQANQAIYPISPITGPSKALKGIESIKSGTSSGVGNALQKLADYAIKRAEQLNPVILVGSGRIIDIVFRKGFILKEQNKENISSLENTNLKENIVTNHNFNQISKEQGNEY